MWVHIGVSAIIVHSSLHTHTHITHIFQELCGLHKLDTGLMELLMAMLQSLLVGCHQNCSLFKREGGEAILGQVFHEAQGTGIDMLASKVLYSMVVTW